MTSHAALAAAVQVQSRFVVTDSVPDIPEAGAVTALLPSMATSHLASVGEVTEIDDDDPVQALAKTQHAMSANSRARTAAEAIAIRLPQRCSRARDTAQPATAAVRPAN